MNYARRMARLSARIFGDVVRKTTRQLVVLTECKLKHTFHCVVALSAILSLPLFCLKQHRRFCVLHVM